MSRWAWTLYAGAGGLYAALWRAGIVRPGGNRWHRERSGDHPPRSDRPLWLHASSLGEVAVARIYASALSRLAPLYLTVTTEAGRAAARESADLPCGFVPVDTRVAVGRFVKHVHPRGLVLIETEIWPHLLRDFGGPVWIANASVSPRSFRRLMRLRTALGPVWSRVRGIFAQSEADAYRFRALGAPEARVHVSGQVKQFAAAPARDLALRATWRARLGMADGEPLWVCGSLRSDELETILALFAGARASGSAARLLIAPRHLNNAARFMVRIRSRGFACTPVSVTSGTDTPPHVMVLDTHGELATAYAAADLVLLGGTWAAHGGHNPNEPARYGAPVVTGPYTENIEGDLALLGDAGIAYRLETPADLLSLARSLAVHDAEQACARLRRLLASRPHPAEALARAVAGEWEQDETP